MLVTSRPDEKMRIIIEMMNERSGLWQITGDRFAVIKDNVWRLSKRAECAAREMISIAEQGERFWQTKAEYYTVLSELKGDIPKVPKGQLDDVIAELVKGSKIDGVSDKVWAKKVLDILTRISKEKQP